MSDSRNKPSLEEQELAANSIYEEADALINQAYDFDTINKINYDYYKDFGMYFTAFCQKKDEILKKMYRNELTRSRYDEYRNKFDEAMNQVLKFQTKFGIARGILYMFTGWPPVKWMSRLFK